jgi:hypothetical protein
MYKCTRVYPFYLKFKQRQMVNEPLCIIIINKGFLFRSNFRATSIRSFCQCVFSIGFFYILCVVCLMERSTTTTVDQLKKMYSYAPSDVLERSRWSNSSSICTKTYSLSSCAQLNSVKKCPLILFLVEKSPVNIKCLLACLLACLRACLIVCPHFSGWSKN